MENPNDGLDAEQRAVVSHGDGPAIVVAGPGAGKTRALTARVAALLERGVAPESIMLLTFTRAAARDMIRRASALDPRAQYATAGTFHAVGSRVVQANARVFSADGSDRPLTVLDEDDAEQLVRKHMEAVKAGSRNWPRASTIRKVISYAANTGRTIAESLEIRAPDHVEHLGGIEAVAEAYAAEKIEKSLIGFDDVLEYWAALLHDEEIGPELRRRWSHVLIDEYQDTNALQARVVEGLVGPGGNVVVVGDASQAIYGFRGGSPAVMRSFRDMHPDAATLMLSTNYRSTPEIVALAGAVDATIDTGFPRRLRAAATTPGLRPEIVDVHDAAAEARAIVEAILADKEAGGDVSDHAVLVRSTATARRIEAEMISARIPFVVQGGTRIDEAAHIRDLLGVARVVCNLGHEPAWLRLLTAFPRIGDRAAAEIAGPLMLESGPLGAAERLRREGAARRTPLAMLADAVEAAAADGPPAERLDRVVAIMTPLWEARWAEEWKARRRDLDAVTLIAQEHRDLESFLTAITLDGSLDRESVHQVDRPDEDPVTISTVHGAKGMEWPTVHVASFVQGGFPSMFAVEDEDRDEELRILFVAVTRARNRLRLYRPRFNARDQFTMASSFEPIVRPHAAEVRVVQEARPGDARVATTRRIDMRARLAARRP